MELIIQTFYAFCVLFLTCEFGERLTIVFDELEYEIEQFDWYLFPNEIQRILLTLMVFGQQEVSLQCFGSTSTNREAFKKVPRFDRMKSLSNSIHI